MLETVAMALSLLSTPYTQSEMVHEIEEQTREIYFAAIEEEAKEEAEAVQAQEVQEVEEQQLPPQRNVWDRLADCESGNWINSGESFEEGSARWDWAKDGRVPPWGTTIHHGGLQFHPGTWSSYKSDHHPTYAYDATREQQIEVAERVLAEQGWQAWPTCARLLGLR